MKFFIFHLRISNSKLQKQKLNLRVRDSKFNLINYELHLEIRKKKFYKNVRVSNSKCGILFCNLICQMNFVIQKLNLLWYDLWSRDHGRNWKRHIATFTKTTIIKRRGNTYHNEALSSLHVKWCSVVTVRCMEWLLIHLYSSFHSVNSCLLLDFLANKLLVQMYIMPTRIN